VLLDSIGETPFFQRKVRPEDIRIFFDAFFRQPFTRYGLHYLKFVVRTLVRHNRMFAEAIRFGIIGHHFHTITREMNKMDKIQSSLEMSYFNFREQIEKYSETVIINSKETLKQASLLFKQSKKSFELLRKKALKIDAGFREQAIKKFNEVSKKAEDVFEEFEHTLRNTDYV
jgi:hypothetical protein